MKTTILRIAGYVAFTLFAFVVGLYLTFPWDAAKSRILDMASKASGTKLAAKRIEPHWLTGVEIEGLEIGDRDPIVIDLVRARAHVLAFLTGKQGFSVWLPLGKGEVDADVTLTEDLVDAELKVSKVQLDQVAPLLAASGLPLVGTLDFNADLVLGRKDPKRTNGKLSLTTEGLSIEKGGKLGMVPVPELTLGNLKLDVPITDGKMEFKNTRLAGTDLEVALDGAVMLMAAVGKSNVNLMLGLKPTEKLLSSDPLLRPILRNFESSKDSEGFYGLSVVGTLQNPRVTPRRR